MLKRFFVFQFIFSIFLISAYSQNFFNIDYYGVESNDLDKNMAAMTSDLYYTQLCEIKNFSISDKRSTLTDGKIPSPNQFSGSNLAFYTVIHKNDSGKWFTTIHIYNPEKKTEMTQTKEYDSYYKILMENKSTLQESFTSIVQNERATIITSNQPSSYIAPKHSISSTEDLAGTWQGEQNIDKILIMRGGRGFVIFKNGASMNIQVQMTNSSILVSQTGKSNASFFPELPRKNALEAALTAEPITWELTLSDDDTLIGTKKTLLPAGESVAIGTVEVEWNRK